MLVLFIILLVIAIIAYFFFMKRKDIPNEKDSKPISPHIMGLRIGSSFDLDPLMLKLEEENLVTKGVAATHIIQSVGVVDMGNGTKIFRFYTDDDAWLQVVAEGGNTEDHVIDVKLFHYYDTRDISSQSKWDDLINNKIGALTWELENNTYKRVWSSESDYHNPVHMREFTYSEDEGVLETDQFTMLFERKTSTDVESLFISAEEKDITGQLERCLVLSTGITLSPSQTTIHG